MDYSFKDQMIWKYKRVIIGFLFLFNKRASLDVALGNLL